MPTLNDYEKFFDSIGIDERKRKIGEAVEEPLLPKHGSDLDSEWALFAFENQIEILVGPEETAWLQTVCPIQPLSATIPNSGRGITHCCSMPGRKLWFTATEPASEWADKLTE